YWPPKTGTYASSTQDISKYFKLPQPPVWMDSLLITDQINTYCQNIKKFIAQNLGKLLMTQFLHEYNK
uniref:eIF3h C-terminal domain-containing protein n=1 Tax=Monodelphis domestica TaxID=13616 RepID=A0A5F8GKP8_MONDO